MIIKYEKMFTIPKSFFGFCLRFLQAERIKNVFSMISYGAATNQEQPLLAPAWYIYKKHFGELLDPYQLPIGRKLKKWHFEIFGTSKVITTKF